MRRIGLGTLVGMLIMLVAACIPPTSPGGPTTTTSAPTTTTVAVGSACWSLNGDNYSFSGTFNVDDNLAPSCTSPGDPVGPVVLADNHDDADAACGTIGRDGPSPADGTMVEDGWVGPPANAWECEPSVPHP